MSILFNENFNKFRGDPWMLPSGVAFDECIRRFVERLPLESALHSFVIEDVDPLLQLLDNTTDMDAIKRVMDGVEGLPALSSAEKAFLKKFSMPPGDLDEFLGNNGWRGAAKDLRDKPSDEFQRIAYDCVTHVLRAYQENNLTFPRDPAESWFNIRLWGFLPHALSRYRILEFKPGQTPSDASARRRNKHCTRDDQQFLAHKADGLVVVSARSLEICYVETAKEDEGTNVTRPLDDTKKLLKLMKDSHDAIREMAIQGIRDRLITFGLRLSGPSLTIFTLRQLPGRFYQAVAEVTVSFPHIWIDSDTGTIIYIISQVLALRKAILAMAASVTTWTALDIDGENFGDDCIASTMTSPQFLSTAYDPPGEVITQLNV